MASLYGKPQAASHTGRNRWGQNSPFHREGKSVTGNLSTLTPYTNTSGR